MQGSRQESALAYPAGRPRTGPEPRMFTSMLTRPSASHRDRGVLAATGKEGRSCSGAPEWTHGYAARRACRGRAPGEVGHLEPALEELADGRVRGGPPALVGLVHQLGAERLGLTLGPGRAREVAALAGKRVAAGVDDDLPGVAPLPDVALSHGTRG
jgi:hypothetical protein